MEHIAMPHDAARSHIQVPCLYNKKYAYDYLDWKSFPERKGFHMGQLYSGKMETKGFHDVLSFIQTWGFFGLLEVIASEFGLRTNPTDFMHWSGQGQCFISTKSLVLLMDEIRRMESIQEDPGVLKSVVATYASTVRGFIYLVHEGQAMIDMPSLYFNNLTESEKELCQTVTLSIACLGEALTKEVNPSLTVKEPPWGRSMLLYDLFRQSGWCSRQVALIEDKTNSLMALYFVSAIDRRPSASMHRECTRGSCDLEHLQTYPRLHASDCVKDNCVNVFVEVLSIVEMNNIPLVTYQGDETGVYKIHTHSFDPRVDSTSCYVAFSHVWSEGLGNPDHNALSHCQILRLQSLANGLYENPQAPTPFWIDTLCIPLHRSGRKRAIATMKDVYHQANKVLILDSLLYETPFNAPPDEILLRIMSSTWVNRLWTLQEVALAKQPYFQLNGGAVLASELTKPQIAGFQHAPPGHHELNRLGGEFFLDIGTKFLGKLIHLLEEPLVDGLRLRKVCQALVSRSTSKPPDEALCIATLLDRNAKDYIEIAEDQRIKELITSLDLVLAEFLFCHLPRYQDDGFRWVPRTLTNLTWHIKPKSCTHCLRGLRGSFKGFRIFPGPGLNRDQPTGVCILVEVEKRRLFVGGGYPGPNLWDAKVEREMAVILSEPRHNAKFTPYREGCLVTVSSIEDNVIYGSWERSIMVDDDTERGIFNDKTPLIGSSVPLLQQWCIG